MIVPKATKRYNCVGYHNNKKFGAAVLFLDFQRNKAVTPAALPSVFLADNNPAHQSYYLIIVLDSRQAKDVSHKKPLLTVLAYFP